MARMNWDRVRSENLILLKNPPMTSFVSLVV